MCWFIVVVDLPCCWLKKVKTWEESEMDKRLEFERVKIDPSPFQLVERTSLHRVGFLPLSNTFLIVYVYVYHTDRFVDQPSHVYNITWSLVEGLKTNKSIFNCTIN